MKRITQNIKEKILEKWNMKFISIQALMLMSFTVVSIIVVFVLGVIFYHFFSYQNKTTITETSKQVMEQTTTNLEDYLQQMRQLSDALYYNSIKEIDISVDNCEKEMSMLYESNKDKLVSFALFSEDGELITASPNAAIKDNIDVTSQEWFKDAINEVENLHFSLPHVQNLFEESSVRYNWVISLSQSVNLTKGGETSEGVLLVDMNYSYFEQILDSVNSNNSNFYLYLIDGAGTIIYHPNQMLISSGDFKENNMQAALYKDGEHEEDFDGTDRVVITDTVGYTGWKLVSVSTNASTLYTERIRYIVVLLIASTFLLLMIVNRYISRFVSKPIYVLDESISGLSKGDKKGVEILPQSTSEVKHLGETIKIYKESNERLVHDIVKEQEEKRKSELDALQAQINPHFLYNTLDSIVWMIEEGGKQKDAVFMITELASLFRLSLSKGKTIIPISDEIKHGMNYMNIQAVRFKNRFTVDFDIDEEINSYCTVKLVVQPILENAIYYGVKNMDENGSIVVKGWKDHEDIYITIEDNGFGIPEDYLKTILSDTEHQKAHGSGVGLINVHKRIQLRFGEEYGIRIESELDEGTKVTIHIPAIPFTKENQELLESGKWLEEEENA